MRFSALAVHIRLLRIRQTCAIALIGIAVMLLAVCALVYFAGRNLSYPQGWSPISFRPPYLTCWYLSRDGQIGYLRDAYIDNGSGSGSGRLVGFALINNFGVLDYRPPQIQLDLSGDGTVTSPKVTAITFGMPVLHAAFVFALTGRILLMRDSWARSVGCWLSAVTFASCLLLPARWLFNRDVPSVSISTPHLTAYVGNLRIALMVGREAGGSVSVFDITNKSRCHWNNGKFIAEFPSPAFAGIGLTISAYPVLKLFRREKLKVPTECQSCGYDLRATPTRCPECGTVPAAGATLL